MTYHINKDIHISIFFVTGYKCIYQIYFLQPCSEIFAQTSYVGGSGDKLQTSTGLISGQMFLGSEEAEKHLCWDFNMVSFKNCQINEMIKGPPPAQQAYTHFNVWGLNPTGNQVAYVLIESHNIIIYQF